MRLIATLATLALFAVAAQATVLTDENFDEVTAGKTVFVKFFAPWCGHCKRLAPAWKKLMDKYEGHATALVGHADCTGDAKELCDSQGVKGFPTLKYGDPNNLEDYEGGRDLSELEQFAEENLKPMCSPKDLDLCEEADRKLIEGFMALSADDLSAKIAEKEDAIKTAGETFDNKLKELQETYEQIQKTRDDTIADVKKSGLGMMKAVQAHNTQKTEL